MIDSSAPTTAAQTVALTRLKRRLERLERPRGSMGRSAAGLFALGAEALDERLGGGLALGALHELCVEHADDQAALCGFALMLSLRAAGSKPILWVREDKGERLEGRLYAPGIIELGGDPDRIILVSAPDTLSALRVGADILGCMEVGAVVIEPYGSAQALDLTASRKLVLAAERSGVAAFVLRNSTSRFASAAATRWQVTAAPSRLLPGDAPGHSALRLSLLRHRGGVAPFETLLEWSRDELVFTEATLSGALLPPAERGQMAA